MCCTVQHCDKMGKTFCVCTSVLNSKELIKMYYIKGHHLKIHVSSIQQMVIFEYYRVLKEKNWAQNCVCTRNEIMQKNDRKNAVIIVFG